MRLDKVRNGSRVERIGTSRAQVSPRRIESVRLLSLPAVLPTTTSRITCSPTKTLACRVEASSIKWSAPGAAPQLRPRPQ